MLESWDAAEDSEAEREKATKAAAAKAQAEAEAKANHKSRSQRIEERRNENMRRLAEAGEGDSEEDEDESTKRARMRQMELEADMRNAEDLFGGVGVKKTTRSAPAIVQLGDPSDVAKAVDLASLRIFNPQTRDQFVELRETLVPLLASNSKKAQYTTFMQEFAKQVVMDLPSDQIKKIASTLTTLSNEKMKEEKAADKGGKKTKAAKTKTTLNASRDASSRADTTAYDDDGLGEYVIDVMRVPMNLC